MPNGAAGVGQWQITVTNDIYDQVTKFNANGTPEASSTATLATTSSLAPYPDLHATGLAVAASSVLQSGGTVTVDWNDSNVGDGTASGSWYDNVTVVNTTTGQTLVNSNPTYSSQSISAGGSTPRSYSFSLPNGTPGVGQLSITVTADAGTSLLEYNSSGQIDTNRSANITAQATLAPYPNLVAATVSAPATTVLGQAVTVSWTDVNQGTAAATGTWSDGIYLYASPTDTHPTFVGGATLTGTLPAGQSSPQSATLTLPLNRVGAYYFGVTTDYLDQVIEAGTVRQDTLSSQATLIEEADLVADSVQPAATSAQFGQPLSVTWTAHNGGNGAALGTWSDQLYLSSQATLNSGSTLLLTQAENANSPLAVGASYSTTATVTLPLSNSLAAGSYYIIAVVNSSNTQLESTASNNQAASTAISLTMPALPDLVVSSVTGPAQGFIGQQAIVFWTDENIGAATATGPWTDTVYLMSADLSQNLGSLAGFAYSGTLAPGGSVSLSELVTLPETPGSYRFQITTNSTLSLSSPIR